MGCLAFVGLLAGCTDGGNGGNGGDDDPASVEEWLADTDNFDGVVDETGTNAVTVEVGPDGNELAFEPAAIRVRPETTVTWKWIDGGSHDVVATDGLFDSGGPQKSGTFEYTFETVGTAYYYCTPHQSAGMKGTVVVEAGDE